MTTPTSGWRRARVTTTIMRNTKLAVMPLQIAKYSPDVQAMLSIFQLHPQLTNRPVAEVSVQIANRIELGIELEHDDV
jgi:hypothetical protein